MSTELEPVRTTPNEFPPHPPQSVDETQQDGPGPVTEDDDLLGTPNRVLVAAAKEELRACLRSRSEGGSSIIPWLRRTELPGVGQVIISISWSARLRNTILLSGVTVGPRTKPVSVICSHTRATRNGSAWVVIRPWTQDTQVVLTVPSRRPSMPTVELEGRFRRDGTFQIKADLETLSMIRDWSGIP